MSVLFGKFQEKQFKINHLKQQQNVFDANDSENSSNVLSFKKLKLIEYRQPLRGNDSTIDIFNFVQRK